MWHGRGAGEGRLENTSLQGKENMYLSLVRAMSGESATHKGRWVVQGLLNADGGASTGCQPPSIDGPSASPCARAPACPHVPLPATAGPAAEGSLVPDVRLQDVSPIVHRSLREGEAASRL